MATKTIDNSGTLPSPDFTTAQAWATYISGLPDLTAIEYAQFHKGTYNEGRIFLNGPATTSSFYLVIQAYAGSEHKGVTGAGVVIEDGTGSSWGVLDPEANLAHIQLQDIEIGGLSSNGEYAVHYTGTIPAGGFFNSLRCIFSGGVDYTNSAFATASLINCIAFDTSASFFSGISSNTTAWFSQYCTVIHNSPYVATSGVSGLRYCIATNCVVMNYGGLNGYFDYLNMDASSDYNASRDTSSPGVHSLDNLTDSNEFMGVGDGSWDFRPKATGALVAAGTPISGITTDIAGNTRSATTPTIGAFEYVAAGGTSHSQTLTDSVTNSDTLIRSTTRTLSQTISNADTILKSSARSLAEAISLSDILTKLRTTFATFAESITHADTLVKQSTRSLAETISHTDTLIRSIIRSLIETVTASDIFSGVKPNTLKNNLIAYWKFDEASGDASDATGNGHTLTNNGTITYGTSSGKINNGASLSGTQYFSGSVISTATNDVSVSFWVNLSSTSLHGCFFHNGNNAATNNGWSVGVGSGTMDTAGNELLVLFDAVAWHATGHSIGTGWHHIAVTADASNNWTGYLDGSSVFTFTASNMSAPSSAFRINYNVDSATRQTSFDIDEFGFYGRELSSTEVSSLYNSGNGNQYPFGSILTQLLTEAITLSDTLIRSIVRTISESISTAVTLVRSAARTLTQSISASDTLTKLRTAFGNFTETITSSDTILRSLIRTFSEAVSNTDTLIKQAAKTFAEAIANSDTVASAVSLGKSFTEAISATDTLLRSIVRSLTEAITNSDTLSTGAFILRVLTEAITTSDTFTHLHTTFGTFVEAISHSDTIVRSVTRNLSEAITNTSTILKSSIKALSDAISSSDTFTHTYTAARTLSEAITNTDTLTKLLNGSLIKWEHITKSTAATWTHINQASAATWTKITKAASAWTHISKSE